MKKRWISVALVLTMLLGWGMPFAAAADTQPQPAQAQADQPAQEEPQAEPQEDTLAEPQEAPQEAPESDPEPEPAPEPAQEEITSGWVVNPLYADVPALEAQEEALPPADNQVLAQTVEATYVSPEAAADQLRQAMIARKREVTLYINVNNWWSVSSEENWFATDFFPMAYSMELAKGAYDGDYLRWSWQGYNWQMSSSGNQYTFRVTLRYYTTAQEEQQLDRRVKTLVSQLGLDSRKPYASYAAAYDYVTSHVAYDNEGLATFADSISGNEDYYIYTAYGAECNGKAVCQGYATLMYALLRSAGLPVRVIASKNHAWNILKLENLWYCADPTWDSQEPGGRTWFLLGDNNFSVSTMHQATDEYRTAAFRAAYPLSPTDYVPGQAAPYYSDVPQSLWSYEVVQRATQLGLFNGVGNGKFEPGMDVSRGMLVTVLFRVAGQPGGSPKAGFADVDRSKFYAEAIDWAAANKIVYGVGDNQFLPDEPANREQVATILYRFAGYMGLNTSGQANLSRFTDQGTLSTFARTPMAWAVNAGLVTGLPGNIIKPMGNTTRDQAAAMLVRMVDTYGL